MADRDPEYRGLIEDQDEPVVDERVQEPAEDTNIGQAEIDDGRNRAVYMGFHMPLHTKGESSKKKKHNARKLSHTSATSSRAESDAPLPPEQHVKFLLGVKDKDDGTAQTIEEHERVFCEMQEIYRDHGEKVGIWREAARWIKFEEDVEDGGDRWSKPHVAALSLHSLFELRSEMLNGTVLLDMDSISFPEIIDLILENMVRVTQQLPDREEVITDVRAQLLANHEHQHEHAQKKHKSPTNGADSANSIATHQPHKNKFARHVPKNSEASNILVGTMECLEKPVMAFVRLKTPVIIPGLCEVEIPTRFIFILLGGTEYVNYYQIGRSISTLMSDDIFHEVAYKSKTRKDLIAGIDEFMDKTTVLPPGEWDPRIRIEPPEQLTEMTKEARLNMNPDDVVHHDPNVQEWDESGAHGDDPALQKTGKLFGGMLADIKRKTPFYLSDWTDCFDLQCLSSLIFLYFAVITPVITFGGLLGDATNNEIAAMESIFGAAIAGSVYHLFSGQPLTIIGATGPILVFDSIVYELCSSVFNIPFLPFRAWIGIWTGIICIILVATDASYLVKYITRYTEESFSTLISLIFIVDGVKKMVGVNQISKFWTHYDKNNVTLSSCACRAPPLSDTTDFNSTRSLRLTMKSIAKTMNDNNYKSQYHAHDDIYFFAMPQENDGDQMYRCLQDRTVAKTSFSIVGEGVDAGVSVNGSDVTTLYSKMPLDQCRQYCGMLEGPDCEFTRDVFLFSLMLSLGTFILATKLKAFKTSRYFPTKVRQLISDFAVITAIALMVCLDLLMGISTPKLIVPKNFEPTLADQRGWVIPLFGTETEPLQTYWAAVAIVPALLATILIFLDQQITAVIVNRRENKLKKGVGYHLDLFIVSIMIIICSCMGLPWFVAATVLSITHVNSLKQESATSAPGEKAQFLGVREQRATGLGIFVLIGCSVFMVDILSYIPMPVLYGVFLYMGVSSLRGVQFVDRLKLLFMPGKHQPDYIYLRHVAYRRVMIFTAIQIGGLALLWIIKKTKPYSIAFPLMVAAIVFIRGSFDKFNVFSQRELSWLDDVMPEDHKKDEHDKLPSDGILLSNGQVAKIAHGRKHVPGDINISKEMTSTGIWKTISSEQKIKTVV